MKKIFIRLLTTEKIYSYSTDEGKSFPVKPNQTVLVETDQIVEEAVVILAPKVESEEGTGKILRAVTAEDQKWLSELKNIVREYIPLARQKVLIYGLKMKILDADLSFDQKKITFYFSSPARVDFRGLVSDMAKSFNKLIRLQQIGPRNEARYFGGIGRCGRELCCAKFLCNFECVTRKYAQDQELMATAGKLTGCCGKLMCCLSFEKEVQK